MEWYEGFTRPFKSLFGLHSEKEKEEIRNNLKRAQTQKTSLGEAYQIGKNVVRNGGQYNPNDTGNLSIEKLLLFGVGAILLLKILD